MMKINVVCVGKLKEKYWTDAVTEYVKRVSRFGTLTVCELAEKKTLEEEGKDILKNVKGYRILCDVGGELVTSEGLAEMLNGAFVRGNAEVTFVIGSSEGVSDAVRSAADKRISFGRVTYPHQLMRVILAEQVYRALTILNNVTYHK